MPLLRRRGRRHVAETAPLGHELVEFRLVLGVAQPFEEFEELALLVLEPAQCLGAVFVERAIAACRLPTLGLSTRSRRGGW